MIAELDYLNQLLEVKSCECILWDRNSGSLPVVKLEKGIALATRLVYERYQGTIPKEKIIIPTCGSPRCINPLHLGEPQTQPYWINHESCESFDPVLARHKVKPKRVVPPNTTKVYAPQQTEEKVIAIAMKLIDGIEPETIAQEEGVAVSTILKIDRGTVWRSITGASYGQTLSGRKLKEKKRRQLAAA